MSTLTPDTVQSWLHEAQDLKISHSRATEIGKLIDPMAAIAREGARNIAFDAEPADFLRMLNRCAGGGSDQRD
jgi:hypothetical protein